MTFAKGIHENKFYGMKDAIAVTLEAAAPKFSVGVNTTVEFSPGNLYWDGGAFRFEANQWSTTPASSGTWNPSHVSHFFWSNTKDWQTPGKEPYAEGYSYSTQGKDDVFFTEAEGFRVGNETGWRTLSKAEWSYLIGESSPGRNASLCEWSAVTFGESGPTVNGLIIMPDGWKGALTATTGYTTWQSLESSGAVFLPAAGYRDRTYVYGAGSYGYCWSGTPHEGYENSAYVMCFYSGSVGTYGGNRSNGYAVRLVR